ncbi:hypothetical protein L7F22_065947 [Adiantum nelumboides]|nr:hypothetical protein [Adiantum nelumboides]
MQSSSRALAAVLRGSATRHWGATTSLQRSTPRRLCSSGGELDTHNDFKPIHKPPEDVLSVKDQIEKDIKENPVLLYMKGVPDAPQCGFSAMTTQILKVHGVPFAARNILEDQELRQAMKTYRLQQAMENPTLQGEVQQQLHAYGILLTQQEERALEKSLGETFKRGLSTAREGENPYQELRNLLLEDSHPLRRRGHAQHEEPPSKEKERNKSPDESMEEDEAPRRRRAQRSPTRTKRKRSPRSPSHRESKREEKD